MVNFNEYANHLYLLLNQAIEKDELDGYCGKRDGYLEEKELRHYFLDNIDKWNGEESTATSVLKQFWQKFDTNIQGLVRGTNIKENGALDNTEMELLAARSEAQAQFEEYWNNLDMDALWRATSLNNEYRLSWKKDMYNGLSDMIDVYIQNRDMVASLKDFMDDEIGVVYKNVSSDYFLAQEETKYTDALNKYRKEYAVGDDFTIRDIFNTYVKTLSENGEKSDNYGIADTRANIYNIVDSYFGAAGISQNDGTFKAGNPSLAGYRQGLELSSLEEAVASKNLLDKIIATRSYTLNGQNIDLNKLYNDNKDLFKQAMNIYIGSMIFDKAGANEGNYAKLLLSGDKLTSDFKPLLDDFVKYMKTHNLDGAKVSKFGIIEQIQASQYINDTISDMQKLSQYLDTATCNYLKENWSELNVVQDIIKEIKTLALDQEFGDTLKDIQSHEADILKYAATSIYKKLNSIITPNSFASQVTITTQGIQDPGTGEFLFHTDLYNNTINIINDYLGKNYHQDLTYTNSTGESVQYFKKNTDYNKCMQESLKLYCNTIISNGNLQYQNAIYQVLGSNFTQKIEQLDAMGVIDALNEIEKLISTIYIKENTKTKLDYKTMTGSYTSYITTIKGTNESRDVSSKTVNFSDLANNSGEDANIMALTTHEDNGTRIGGFRKEFKESMGEACSSVCNFIKSLYTNLSSEPFYDPEALAYAKDKTTDIYGAFFSDLNDGVLTTAGKKSSLTKDYNYKYTFNGKDLTNTYSWFTCCWYRESTAGGVGGGEIVYEPDEPSTTAFSPDNSWSNSLGIQISESYSGTNTYVVYLKVKDLMRIFNASYQEYLLLNK